MKNISGIATKLGKDGFAGVCKPLIRNNMHHAKFSREDKKQSKGYEFILVDKNDFNSMKESLARLEEATERAAITNYKIYMLLAGTGVLVFTDRNAEGILYAYNSVSSTLSDYPATLGDGAITEQDSALYLG